VLSSSGLLSNSMKIIWQPTVRVNEPPIRLKFGNTGTERKGRVYDVIQRNTSY
jgi:hypothetical protein